MSFPVYAAYAEIEHIVMTPSYTPLFKLFGQAERE